MASSATRVGKYLSVMWNGCLDGGSDLIPHDNRAHQSLAHQSIVAITFAADSPFTWKSNSMG